MATFFMFGTYSSEAMEAISADRTDQAIQTIRDQGGEVEAMYALLGERDLVFIVDLPDVQQAMKASVMLSRSTGISFTSSPAVGVRDFDALMAET